MPTTAPARSDLNPATEVDPHAQEVVDALGGLVIIKTCAATAPEPILLPVEQPEAPSDEERAQFLRKRWDAYRRARTKTLELARDPARRENPLIRDLLDQMLELQIALEQDETGADPEWQVREVVEHILDVLGSLQREIEHLRLDEPQSAARFVLEALDEVDQPRLADLAGVDPRTIRSWKAGQIPVNWRQPERIILLAQLVYDLRNSMSPRGIVMWFNRKRPQLGDATPLELMNESIADAAEPLRALARGARGQLAT